ncbi:MAG: hypothetical protein ACRDV4_11810 [Acidimicrobiales bacterium]
MRSIGVTTQVGDRAHPLSTLRGARVEVDSRRVARFAGAVCILALAASVAVLFVSGAQKNAQINRLHDHGVVVEATVTGCLGLLGGSGSNATGYTCRGTFELDGHHYREIVPGDSLHAPGTKLRVVTVPGDPALVSTARTLEGERASAKVFVLPAVLLGVPALLVGAIVVVGRRARATHASAETGSTREGAEPAGAARTA